MTRAKKHAYAIKLLSEKKIKVTSTVLTVNCYGDIVIHSKQFKNCIIIPPQATKKTIQIKIENAI